MRRVTVGLVMAGLCGPIPLTSQVPVIGGVELYGLGDLSQTEVLEVLGVTVGDLQPSSVAEIIGRLEELRGVHQAYVTTVCCGEDGRATFFAGLRRAESPAFEVRRPPQGDSEVPTEVLEGYRRYEIAIQAAISAGDFRDDMSAGHSLMPNPGVREAQERFIDYAQRFREHLQEVVRTAGDSEHRKIAAHVLGYSSDKRMVVEDLLYAARDSAREVRNSAVRALTAIALLSGNEPQLGIDIPPDLMFDMLESVVWSDRNKATALLFFLTSGRDEALLAELRGRAVPSLAEMAGWQTPHAQFPFYVLGRVAGRTEAQIEEAWLSEDRLTLITSWLMELGQGSVAG